MRETSWQQFRQDSKLTIGLNLISICPKVRLAKYSATLVRCIICGDRGVEKANVDRDRFIMKSALPTFLVVLASACFSTSATAADMPGLIVEQGCNNCHKLERKLVGPTWMEISRKYKDNDAALSKLSKKIIAGGSGVWGPVPMPGYPMLSDPEIAEVVAYILKLSE